MSLISVIVPCKNEGVNIQNTVSSILQANNMLPYEVIVVDDCCEDGCTEALRKVSDKRFRLLKTSGLGAPQARNFGAAHAQGEILVFCDAHVFVPDRWLDTMLRPLLLHEADVICPGIAPHNDVNNVGYGQKITDRLEVKWYVIPPKEISEVAVSPGGCQAMTRKAFETVDGYDNGFKVWGYEDIEISIKLWLFGLRLVVDPKVKVLHVFRQTHPYKVEFLHVHHNLVRMAVSHFNFRRYRKTLNLIKDFSWVDEVVKDVNTGDAWKQRVRYFKNRVHDDDWYFAKFGVPF